jgi:hypothetical protein
LLFSSGGSLEFKKCFTYVIKWTQDEEGRHKISEENEQIEITDSQTGITKKINCKKPNESHKTLGCFKNPSMDFKQQAREIKKKADTFSRWSWAPRRRKPTCNSKISKEKRVI